MEGLNRKGLRNHWISAENFENLTALRVKAQNRRMLKWLEMSRRVLQKKQQLWKNIACFIDVSPWYDMRIRLWTYWEWGKKASQISMSRRRSSRSRFRVIRGASVGFPVLLHLIIIVICAIYSSLVASAKYSCYQVPRLFIASKLLQSKISNNPTSYNISALFANKCWPCMLNYYHYTLHPPTSHWK